MLTLLKKTHDSTLYCGLGLLLQLFHCVCKYRELHVLVLFCRTTEPLFLLHKILFCTVDSAWCSSSSIVFATAGVLIEDLRVNGLKALHRFRSIVLDEAHERSVESDLAMACIKMLMLKHGSNRRWATDHGTKYSTEQ